VLLAALALLAFLLAGCDGGGDKGCEYNGHHHEPGETFPSATDCNTCTCTATGVACTERACTRPDANPASCAKVDPCTAGPSCGDLCCNQGEHCVDGACKCGEHDACKTGDLCSGPGPAGGEACGTICCGKTGPCPL